MMRSASDPTCSAPFFGKRPKAFDGRSAHDRAMSGIDNWPSSTRASIDMHRVCKPGMPGGVRQTSLQPSSLSSRNTGEWSLTTISISPDRTAERRRVALVAGSDRRNDDAVRSQFDRFLLGEQEMVRHHFGRQRQRVAKTPDQIDALLRRQRSEMDARAGLARDGACSRDAKALRQGAGASSQSFAPAAGDLPCTVDRDVVFPLRAVLQLGELCDQEPECGVMPTTPPTSWTSFMSRWSS